MTPLFKKLNYKNQSSIIVLNSPESFENELTIMSEYASIVKELNNVQQADFSIVFVMQLNQIHESIASLYPLLKGDAVLWFCYPKATSKKYKCDFNRDTGWQELGKYGLEGVRMVAVDEDWSALRFRKTEYIKNLARGFVISDEGKKRTGV